MSRDIPFDPNAKCDECGNLGAFDFMGDFICGECLNHYNCLHVDSEDISGTYLSCDFELEE